jgi:polysaccharide export outer membrane protein
MQMKYIILAVVLLFGSTASHAQEASETQKAALPEEATQKLQKLNERLLEEAQSKGNTNSFERQDYRIGTEDLIDISVFEVPELSRTVRVSAAGEISLPLLGTVRVAGLSPLELERLLTELLRRSYVKDPQVVVFLREFHSDPVSVVGAVKLPGLYHIQTRKSLVEILAMAQGFSDGPGRLAGRSIVITRKAQPSVEAVASGNDSSVASDPIPAGGSSLAPDIAESPEIIEVPIKELMQSGDPKWNIPIFPGDVVKVIPAGTVYVAGDVARPGGFPLTDFDNISALQALSMAGGPLRTAVRKNSVIIRRDAAGKRIEQKIDLTQVLNGKQADVMLGPNDILFLPGSASKAVALRTLESSIQMATGMLIYNRPF